MAQSHIRASDAEREKVAAFLRDQAGEGRLTPDELEERVGRAYAAVTIGDLRRLVSDLPQPPTPRRRVGPAHRPPRGLLPLGFAALIAFAMPTLAVALFWVAFALGVAALVTVAALGFAFGPFILFGALIALALRRRRARRWHAWGPPRLP